ncbi:hypothetical protein CA850_29815 [Micromonospora echinospora]|uniref:ADP-ribosyltransferase exoenzyme n=1 Tax=Micromonospora echinospora TaxID=1877 RepID=A0A1C5AAR1_MICEC|nr:ADP-ribosyltransferase [Micromonospora echinospora]OZV74777.1 hypothetical protein CA850_29815 [Micromonospora echinospora]SCF42285.1 ADP-ribosyltransferase exoenzyme [Micromonospora echinospora]
MAALTTHNLAESYRVTQAKVATEAAAGVALAVKTLLNPANLTKSFPAYAAAAGKIIADARVKAAEQGGAFYLAHRKASGVTGAMPEIAWAPQLPAGQLATSLLVTGPVAVKKAFTMGASVPQALAAAEVKAAGAAYRHTANGGRGTIKGTAYRDAKAIGWARVSDGRPCDFCAMLASRGAVYESATTAGLTDDGDRYHDNCGCFVVPVYTRSDPIPGLGPQLEKLWKDATKRAKASQGTDEPKTASQMFRALYRERYPEGSNPSQMIADAHLDAFRLEAEKNRTVFEAKAAREAEKAAKAAAEAAAEAERIAQAAAEGMSRPKPKRENLKHVGTAGGSHGATIWEDTSTGERWIFKPQADVMNAIDVATAKLAKRVGRPAADTYAFELDGRLGSLQRMLPGGDAFPGPDSQRIDPTALSDADALALQKEHVIDWLFANHDAHKANFVRDADGQLAGIDKGQALKFFGRDRLDWTFHANEHEPIYTTIYRAFAEGKDVALQDPAQGELSVFIRSVMDMPDDDLRDLFRPYAEAAARRGWLLTGNHWKPDALEPLAAGLKPNDVSVFLDALVARKNRLAGDFAQLYARAKAERTKVEAEAKAAAAKAALVKKWKGKPAPAPPDKPKPPQVDRARYFDGWLAKVKARYEAFAPGKKLEDSLNWHHVQAVIDGENLPALEALKDGHYVDWDLYQEAADLWGDVAEAQQKADQDGDYLKALRSYKNRLTRYKRYLAEWREVNGSGGLAGMDADAVKHSSFDEGDAWATRSLTVPRGEHAEAITTYSGSSYEDWNGALRTHADPHTPPPGTWAKLTTDADGAFAPTPEAVVVHRGTTWMEFAFPDGTRTGSLPPPDPRELIGTVQVQHGYGSVSVGHRSAFSFQPVQLVIRVPAGHGATWVRPISRFPHEYEVLLQRSTRSYVHDIYQDPSGTWVVELEVLPMDADPASYAGLTPMPRAVKPPLNPYA